MNTPLATGFTMQQHEVFELFNNHIQILQSTLIKLFEKTGYETLIIHSGELIYSFLDDRTYPFKVNPLFNYWVPVNDVPNCWVIVDGINKPKLWFYSPVDYWHNVEPLPTDKWTDSIDVLPLTDKNAIKQQLNIKTGKTAYIGSAKQTALDVGFAEADINPVQIINFLHYHRSYKTDYELACLKQAQIKAVLGHQNAQYAFLKGLSEYEINAAYLLATGQRDTDVPYANIVAINQNASVLHYTKLHTQPVTHPLSFLLDAGAEFNGYAADLTRTTSFDEFDEFNKLIGLVNRHQQDLISHIKSGVRYTDIHVEMENRIANILIDFEIIKGLSVEEIVNNGISSTFFPHGIGHPLGLQVHDVAGFMQDEDGTHLSAPKAFPYLRCTRILEPRMVLTIEPGLYFIDSLLSKWRTDALTKHFDWDRIEHFKPYGGVRIEDNIIIKADSVENMTRDLDLA